MFKSKCSCFFAMIAIFLTMSCTTVVSISISQIPAKKLRKGFITAKANGFNILSIPFGSDFAMQAHKNFLSKCRGGAITGVLSKHTHTSYFIVNKSEVVFSGYCQS